MVELENLKDIWKQHIDPTIDKQNIERSFNFYFRKIETKSIA